MKIIRSSILVLIVLSFVGSGYCWGNGYSIYGDPIFADSVTGWKNTNMYGTHDYLAQKALEMLAEAAPEEAMWINQRYYFYGTELPDSLGMGESINDRAAQYLTFDGGGRLIDDSLAKQSMKRYDQLIAAIKRGDIGTASKFAGTLAAYVSNAGLFSRVVDTATNGKNFEDHILFLTDIKYPSPEFEEKYGDLSFDGKLESISPYDATIRLGQRTYLGSNDPNCCALCLEENYDLESQQFIDCARDNFENIVNAIVDVLHTAYVEANSDTSYERFAYDWDTEVLVTRQAVAEQDDVTESESEVEGADEDSAIASDSSNTDIESDTIKNQIPSYDSLGKEPPSAPDETKGGLGPEYLFVFVAIVLAIVLLTLRNTGGCPLSKQCAKAPKNKGKRSSISKK